MPQVKKIDIYHNAFGDVMSIVGSIDGPTIKTHAIDHMSIEDTVYHYTQNLNIAWWKTDVIQPSSLVVHNKGCRSTSIGDLFKITYEDDSISWKMVDVIGFTDIDDLDEPITVDYDKMSASKLKNIYNEHPLSYECECDSSGPMEHLLYIIEDSNYLCPSCSKVIIDDNGKWHDLIV